MRELLHSVISTSKDRISNPIIGTFIISWIVFNWKSLLFILISNQKIEDKILYIESNFYSIKNLLIFPLTAVIIYVVILPYVTLLFEYVLEFSRIKRNYILISKQKQIIINKNELAIEEIMLEENLIKYRERNNENKLLEALEKSIEVKEEQLSVERQRNNVLSRKMKEESSYLNKRFQEDKKEFEILIKSLKEENNLLKENLYKSKNTKSVNDRILDIRNKIQ